MNHPEVGDTVRHTDAPAGWTDLRGEVEQIDGVMALVAWDHPAGGHEQIWEHLDRLAVVE